MNDVATPHPTRQAHATLRTEIGVLGAGRWGTTLAWLAASGDRKVRLWTDEAGLVERIAEDRRNPRMPELDALPPGLRATSDLAEIAAHCHLLVLAVPVGRLRPLARQLGDLIDGSHVVVHAVRGIEADSFALPSRVLAEETCARKVGALLGAALVDELVAGRPNAAVVASRFSEVIEATRAALAGNSLHIQGCADIVGVEAAAAAASAVALALGMCLELGFGPAAMASALTRGSAEVARLAVAQGGEERSAFGLAGLGYLLVERESESRDVQAGRMLAQGHGLRAVLAELGPVDAVQAARAFGALATRKRVDAPVVQAVVAALDGRATAQAVAEGMVG